MNLANIIFIHPNYWLQAINFSINNIDNLTILIPEQYEMQLLTVSKTIEFCQVPEGLLKKLESSDNLLEIAKISKCLKKLFHKEMVLISNLEDHINDIIEPFLVKIILEEAEKNSISETSSPEFNLIFTKLIELFSIFHKKINERAAVSLGKFLISQG